MWLLSEDQAAWGEKGHRLRPLLFPCPRPPEARGEGCWVSESTPSFTVEDTGLREGARWPEAAQQSGQGRAAAALHQAPAWQGPGMASVPAPGPPPRTVCHTKTGSSGGFPRPVPTRVSPDLSDTWHRRLRARDLGNPAGTSFLRHGAGHEAQGDSQLPGPPRCPWLCWPSPCHPQLRTRTPSPGVSEMSLSLRNGAGPVQGALGHGTPGLPSPDWGIPDCQPPACGPARGHLSPATLGGREGWGHICKSQASGQGTQSARGGAP